MDAHGDRLVPAIVVGSGQTGLGTLRCLRLAGIPSFIACPAGDLATRSRWYRPTPGHTAWDGRCDAAALDLLRRMPLEHAVLVPGADDAALWLSRLPDDLRARFPVSSSAPRTLEILQDKARFGEHLATNGIPHPRTFPIRRTADIDAIPFGELDRVFLKPTNSQLFLRVTGAKGLWARNRVEMEAIWHRLEAHGLEVLAQEYVPGDATQHYFVDGFRDRNGTLTGLFARRRWRIFPPDFGNSSYCRSVPLEEVGNAVDSLDRLLAGLGYRGIFSAEFKRDARDGTFRILEVNTRAWWYVEFAARCGVNVCRMAWQDALGLAVEPAPRNYPVGAGCVNLPGDIITVRSQPRAARGPLHRILAQWVRAHYHVFRLDDPRPGLSVAWEILGRLLRNAGRRPRAAAAIPGGEATATDQRAP